MLKFAILPRVFITVMCFLAVVILTGLPLLNVLGNWIQNTRTKPYVEDELTSIKNSLKSKKEISDEKETTSPIPGLSTTPESTTIVKEFTTYISSGSAFPTATNGCNLYATSDGWKAGLEFYTNGLTFGMGTTDPRAKLHISTTATDRVGLIVQGVANQSDLLQDFRDSTGKSLLNVNALGKVTLNNVSDDHALEIYHTGNAGYLSSSGGAIYLNNTNNLGTGLGIFSDAGSEALGNMINIKVDNPLYNQAAFSMNYDGISNAVEIVANTNDESSNALSITNFNRLDSALGVIGYGTGKGTIKVSHNGTGSDANASGLSVDLKGSGTRAQGLYVDSTADTGTLGNLLRLRNQSIDRFVVDYTGSLKIGGNGYNTTITKYGNTTGDEFFIGTTGAFRVQRSASGSETFRVQINGDSQGRWLRTSDGQLKWGDGSTTQDVILKRSAANTLQLTSSTFQVTSRASNTDLMVWTASDNSRLGRFTETTGGAGWLEIDDASGVAQIVFRGDGGNSYINSGNFGIGTTSFGTSASKVLSIGNGTAPTTSITDGIQLYAIDYNDADGTSTSELFVRDEDGNATNLSPHNFSLMPMGKSEPLAWSYYSEKNGQAINVDMAKTIRLVEQLSGTQLIYMKDLMTGESLSSLSLAQPSVSFSSRNESSVSLEDIEKIFASEKETFLKKEELDNYLMRKNDVLEVMKKLVVSSIAVFQQSVEFVSAVIFKNDVLAEKNLEVKGVISVNNDQAGEASITKGQTSVSVTFTIPYETSPVITATPLTSLKGNYWVEKNEKGFIIHISESQNTDVSFDWHAFLNKDKKVVTSPESPVPTILQTEEKNNTASTPGEEKDE